MLPTPVKKIKASANFVELKASDYIWPSFVASEHQVQVRPTVKLDKAWCIEQFGFGTTWDMLERFYCVDQATLKKHLFIEYERAQADLKMNLIRATVATAISGNHAAQKFLCTNWLGMTQTPEVTIKPQEYNEKEVNERLENLQKKSTKEK